MEADYLLEVVRIVFYSGLVLLLIYFFGLYLRRLPFFTPTGKQIQVLERISLGPKQGLYLVQIKKEQVLLGVSEGRMQMLKEFGERDGGDGDDGEPE